jgi:ligand-binding sensor domain-containing protein
MKTLILTGLLLTCCLHSHAQQPALYFGRITTEKGLSNNHVNCILQDRRGFMWIGTNDGLNRYDGNHFIIFRNTPGDSTSLPGNMINDIIEDEDGVLWIATGDGGLGRYDYRQPVSRQFRQYKHMPADTNSIPANGINKVVADRQGFLWLASNGFSVIRFHKASGKFDRPVSGGPRTALSLAFDHNGILWVGREGGGLLKIDPVNRQYESDPRYQDLYARLPHVVVTSLFRE